MDGFRKLCFLSTSFLFILSCSNKKPEVTRAYYYWRTNGATWQERKFLKQNGIRKLYAHLMDVDWSNVFGAIPVANHELVNMNLEFVRYDSFPVQIVPVVFITNKTFERIDSSDIETLAIRLVRRCLPAYDAVDRNYESRNHSSYFGLAVKPNEIQFDCDWTETTRGKYFAFLRKVKSLLPSDSIKVSATIRLHQFKYPNKTGVPPVDRGMLMIYNISDPKKYGTDNSIFEEKKAAAYFTSNKKYPLPLDMALPAWSWCIIYRNKQFYQVENELDEQELKTLSFLRPRGNHFYQVTQDTVFRDLFLRPGDEIKAESTDKLSLKAAAKLATKAVNADAYTVSLFELSEQEIQRYNNEKLLEVYSSFR